MAYDKVIDSAVLNANLTTVADAIRAKGGTSAALAFPDGFVSAVGAIEAGSGGETTAETDVTFHDYDGTLLYAYTIEEAQALTALPDGPTHDGLVFDGWNWTLEEVKALTYPMQIGAHYITDDGATRLYMHFDAPLLHTYLRWRQDVSGGVSIDWGDGSDPETFEGSGTTVIVAEHTYAAEGDYVIRMMPQDDCTMVLYSGSHMYSIIGWRRTSSNVYAYDCRLTRVELGRNLGKTVGYAFLSSRQLETIAIPRYVAFSLTDNDFQDCCNLRAIVIPPTTEHPKWMSQCYRLKTVCLPPNTTQLKDSAFKSCWALKKITLPEGVVSIGKNAFYDAYALHEIRIPTTVTNIGESVFQNCYGLKRMPEWPSGINFGANTFNMAYVMCGDVVIPDGVTSIGNSAFRFTNIESISMPDTVESIGNSAFQSTLLTGIEWPAGLQTLGTYTFYACKALKRISVPDGITTVPQYFCYDCDALTDVYIPDGVTTIDADAFEGSNALAYLDIPASVNTINAKAFSGNTGMVEYHFRSTTPPTLANTNAFSGIPDGCIIYVPTGCLEAYQTATNWSTYASYMQEEASA